VLLFNWHVLGFTYTMLTRPIFQFAFLCYLKTDIETSNDFSLTIISIFLHYIDNASNNNFDNILQSEKGIINLIQECMSI